MTETSQSISGQNLSDGPRRSNWQAGVPEGAVVQVVPISKPPKATRWGYRANVDDSHLSDVHAIGLSPDPRELIS